MTDSARLPISPSSPALIGLAALARIAMPGNDLSPIGQQLLERANNDPQDPHALMDLSIVLQLGGHRDQALAVQQQALTVNRVYRRAARGNQPAARLLALMTDGDLMANTPLEFLLEDSDIELTMLYLEHDKLLPDILPPHDIAFVAVGESRRNRRLLERLRVYAQHSATPVLNAGQKIAGLARDRVSVLLRSLPGVMMPSSMIIERGDLAAIAAQIFTPAQMQEGATWPIIVRPSDSHAGHGLGKLDSPAELRTYMRASPFTESFCLSSFVDYRDGDGCYRKYRVLLIDGQPHICHLAISDHWMIHYLNAGMNQHAGRRDEEARVMAGFDEGFARRHAQALQAIHATLGLEYVALDCAETADGKLLIFEADTAIIVHAMDPPDIYAYKQAPMQRIFDAFRRLVIDRRDQGVVDQVSATSAG